MVDSAPCFTLGSCGVRAGMMTAPVGGHMPAQRLVAERRWRLGVHSRGHPSAVVAELLRALQVRAALKSAQLGLVCPGTSLAGSLYCPCWQSCWVWRNAFAAHGVAVSDGISQRDFVCFSITSFP